MDTQNTPVHLRLWHRSFWSLATAHLLLSMAVYMQVVLLPLDVLSVPNSSAVAASAMAAFVAGLFLLGPFYTYWVQRYRRNHVCRNAVLLLAVVLWLISFFNGVSRLGTVGVWIAVALRLFLGMAYAVAQTVLIGTLIVDKCESFQRTGANYAAAWIGRLSLALGPLVVLVAGRWLKAEHAALLPVAASLVALVLVSSVHFPFRSPEDDIPLVSLDRFFLPQSKWLFVNLLLAVLPMGLLLSHPHVPLFYCCILGGFFLGIMAERFAFADATLRSEAITGLLFNGVAWLLLLTRHDVVVTMLVPLCMGFGTGLIGSRFLLFFLKLSGHCQRGTAQSSFFLAWESGLAVGLALGYLWLSETDKLLLWVGLGITVAAFGLYQFFVHDWYVRHKNR